MQVYIQTSKNIQTGQSYMYVSHYNLKQNTDNNLKYVLSEFQGRRDFRGVGIKGGYLEAVVFERAWKDR